MRAALINKHGDIDQLVIDEVDIPTINPHEVLLEVKSVALNRLDIWVRKGSPALKIPLPHIGGSDFSGVVKDIGKEVTDVSIGDRVVVNAGVSCNNCDYCRRGEHSLCTKFHLLGEHVWGGTAQFAVVPATNVLQLPDHIEFVEAAATSLTALTVYRMLVGRAKIKQTDRILVIGSGGGIGTMAVQIANVLGGEVIALTSSTEKMKLAKELGASSVINYKENPDWGKEVWTLTGKKGVDIVVDSVGEVVWEQALRSLAKGGRLVTCGATSGFEGKTNIALVFWKQLSILGSTMASENEFREAMDLLFTGKIKPVIDAVFPLEEIKAAHQRLEAGEHTGKIVLTI
ncbi:MAG: zinc-binding dehydrogenase [Candidatus Kariarchaeaceae archaeon]|jgi:NADPH2:quinone reductase